MISGNNPSIQPYEILNNLARTVLSYHNVENINIITIPMENDNTPIASVVGLSIPSNVFIDKNTVFAVIFINKNLINYFHMREWKFIISHECGHLIFNHVLTSLIVNAPEIYANLISILKNNPIYKLAYDLIKLMIPLLVDHKVTTIDKELIRKVELEADSFAVRYTGDIEAAKTVLNKISQGNIDVPTHYFKLANSNFPALTVEERIQNINNSFG